MWYNGIELRRADPMLGALATPDVLAQLPFNGWGVAALSLSRHEKEPLDRMSKGSV